MKALILVFLLIALVAGSLFTGMSIEKLVREDKEPNLIFFCKCAFIGSIMALIFHLLKI